MESGEVEVRSEAQLEGLQRGGELRLALRLGEGEAREEEALLRRLEQGEEADSLESLRLLRGSSVHAEALCRLAARCKSLSSLRADGCELGDEVVAAFARGSGASLRVISLRSSNVSDVALCEVAAHCPSLTELNVNACKRMSDSALSALAQGCSQLTTLGLSHCDITDGGVIALAHGCHSLASLDLNCCKNVSDASILAVSKTCPSLELLSLRNCAITAAAVIAMAQKCVSLTHLDLSYCWNVSDVSLQALSNSSPLLSVLNLSGCLVSDTGIISLSQGCPALSSLNLSCCENITDSSIFEMTKSCIHLEHLNPRHCPHISAIMVKKCCISFSYQEYCVVTLQSYIRRVQATKKVRAMLKYKKQCDEIEKSNYISELEMKVTQTDLANAALQQEVDSLTTKLTNFEEKDLEHTKTQAILENQMTQTKEVSQNELVDAKHQCQTKEKEIASLNSDLKDLESTITHNSTHINTLLAENEALRSKEFTSFELISSLEAELQNIRNHVTTLEMKCKNECSKREATEATVVKLNKQIAEMDNSLGIHRHDLLSTSEEVLSLKRDLADCQLNKSKALSQSSAVVTSLQSEIDELENMLVDSQGKFNEKCEEIHVLSEELSVKNHNINSLETQLFWKSKEITSVSVERDNLLRKLDALEKNNESLMKKIASTNNEMTNVCDKLKESQANVKQILFDKKKLENEVNDVNKLFLEALGVAENCATVKKLSHNELSDIKNKQHDKSEEDTDEAQLSTSTTIKETDKSKQAQSEVILNEQDNIQKHVVTDPIKSKSKLKEQYLNHLASVKMRDQQKPKSCKVGQLPATSKIQIPLKPSKKLTSTSTAKTRSLSTDTTTTCEEMSLCSAMSKFSMATNKSPHRGGGEDGDVMWPITPRALSSNDLHEPDVSVHSCGNSTGSRVYDDVTRADRMSNMEGFNVEVTLVDDSNIVEEETRDPLAPPQLYTGGISFNHSGSIGSVHGRSSVGRSVGTHQPSDNLSQSRATSTEKLRVWGEEEFKGNFKEDSGFNYIFNRESYGYTGRARSPSQDTRRKFLSTSKGVAAIGGLGKQQQIYEWCDNKSTKIYKNSSKGVSSVMRGSGHCSSPPKSLSRMLSHKTPPKNNIF